MPRNLSPLNKNKHVGAWRSLVAHLHGVQGVPSSNLGAPTNINSDVVNCPSEPKATGVHLGVHISRRRSPSAHHNRATPSVDSPRMNERRRLCPADQFGLESSVDTCWARHTGGGHCGRCHRQESSSDRAGEVEARPVREAVPDLRGDVANHVRGRAEGHAREELRARQSVLELHAARAIPVRPDVEKYLSNAVTKWLDLNALEAEADNLAAAAKNAARKRDLSNWFHEQASTGVKKLFWPLPRLREMDVARQRPCMQGGKGPPPRGSYLGRLGAFAVRPRGEYRDLTSPGWPQRRIGFGPWGPPFHGPGGRQNRKRALLPKPNFAGSRKF